MTVNDVNHAPVITTFGPADGSLVRWAWSEGAGIAIQQKDTMRLKTDRAATACSPSISPVY